MLDRFLVVLGGDQAAGFVQELAIDTTVGNMQYRVSGKGSERCVLEGDGNDGAIILAGGLHSGRGTHYTHGGRRYRRIHFTPFPPTFRIGWLDPEPFQVFRLFAETPADTLVPVEEAIVQ